MTRTRAFTLIELMVVIAIIAIIAAIAIPNLIQARKHGNETAAIGALKTVATAEAIFREGDKDSNGTLDYGSLAELSAAQVIDGVLGGGSKQGYVFQADGGITTAEFLWFAVANPTVSTVTGDRYFCVNFTGAIFYTGMTSIAFNSTDCMLPSTTVPVGK